MTGAKIIVDGYNLLLAGRGPIEKDSLWLHRDQVINQLCSYAARKKIRVVLVFDGREKIRDDTRSLHSLHVLFSRLPENADALIKRLVEKERQPARHVTVVTSDRAIAAYVKSCGCIHWTTEVFRKKMAEQRETPAYDDKFQQSVSRGDMEEWLKLFGVDGEQP